MTSPPPGGPEFSAPTFQTCYRHPERQTGIVCQRCRKPICGECMNPASVGFQCPECIGRGRQQTRAPRTAYGGVLSNRQAPVTKIIMIAVGALTLLNYPLQGLVTQVLAMSPSTLGTLELWRPFTYGFVAQGLFATALNLFVLWIAGQALEGLLGSGRYLALYLLAGFGGATAMLITGAPLLLPGASIAIIGLLAANATVKLKRRESIAPDLGLLAILVGLGFVLNMFGSAQVALFLAITQLGAIITGGLAGIVLAFAPRERRTLVQTVGLLAIFVLCLLALVVRIAIG